VTGARSAKWVIYTPSVVSVPAAAHVDGRHADGTTEEYAKSSGDWRDWRRELLAAEREAVLSLRDAGEISPVVMRRIERDLDLQESRLGG
jgi:hypothetical protein